MSFSDWLLSNEAAIRLSCFLLIFTLMAIWEGVKPFRQRRFSRTLRWGNNLALLVLNSLLLRLTFPVAAVGVAYLSVENGWGVLNQFELPLLVILPVSVILLDMLIYLQHLLFHKVPFLWRLHRVHHADPDYDVTTGTRFHPVEIVLSMLIKMGVVLVLGIPAEAVILFEIILNGSAMFNHANIQLPEKVDRWLRLLVVTPDMHRVHHSQYRDETDSNYGFALSCWDRIFSTYRQQSLLGQDNMLIGLQEFQDKKTICWLNGILLLPFRR